MIKKECKKASQFLLKLFNSDSVMLTKIAVAEANNDYETLRKMLLYVQEVIGRLQGEIVSLDIALKKLEDRACLESENTEYDCGHNVKHNSEEI